MVYQWTITNFFNNGLSIIRNVNLNTNIGFGANTTHTNNSNDAFSNLKTEKLLQINHPLVMLPNKEADFFTLNRELKSRKEREKNVEEIKILEKI